MSLKKKAAQIDLGKLVAGATANSNPTVNSSNPGAGLTAIGMHAESVYRDRKIAEDNKTLKDENAGLAEKLAEFNGAEIGRKLDPTKVRASHWANRSEDSYKSKKFEDLKSEIASAGGNVQPIKVRRMARSPEEYEIIFGHRRHRACLELGLDVLASIEENISDVELFEQMDRENRQRADLRPYEQGVMYARALNDGLFPSLRKMAEKLGVNVSDASKAVAIARLPQRVQEAFNSPLDIQFNWAALLTKAIQKDPDAVLIRATELSNESPKLVASKVLERLLGHAEDGDRNVDVIGKSGVKAKISFNTKKNTVSISIRDIDRSKLNLLEKLLKEL